MVKFLIRVVNYINMLSDLLSNGLINLISDILSVIVTLGFMLMIDPVLTLYSLALIPVLFVIVMVIKTAQRKAYQVLSNKQSNMNAYIHESIAGIKVTQSFSREEENFEIFTEVSNEYRRSWMKAVKIQFLLWPGVQNIAVMTTCLIYFVGIKGYGVDVSTGTLIAFIGYVGNFGILLLILETSIIRLLPQRLIWSEFSKRWTLSPILKMSQMRKKCHQSLEMLTLKMFISVMRKVWTF